MLDFITSQKTYIYGFIATAVCALEIIYFLFSNNEGKLAFGGFSIAACLIVFGIEYLALWSLQKLLPYPTVNFLFSFLVIMALLSAVCFSILFLTSLNNESALLSNEVALLGAVIEFDVVLSIVRAQDKRNDA